MASPSPSTPVESDIVLSFSPIKSSTSSPTEGQEELNLEVDSTGFTTEWRALIREVESVSVRNLWSPIPILVPVSVSSVYDRNLLSSAFQFPDPWELLYEERRQLKTESSMDNSKRDSGDNGSGESNDVSTSSGDSDFFSPTLPSPPSTTGPEPATSTAGIWQPWISPTNTSTSGQNNEVGQSSSFVCDHRMPPNSPGWFKFPNISAPDFHPSSPPKQHFGHQNNQTPQNPFDYVRNNDHSTTTTATPPTSYGLWDAPQESDGENEDEDDTFNLQDLKNCIIYNNQTVTFVNSEYAGENKGLKKYASPPRRPPSRTAFLRPMDFFTYATEKVQYVFSESSFVIQILSIPPGETTIPLFTTLPKCFKAVYADPLGFEHPVFIRNSPTLKNTFFGIFYPNVPGSYVISVFLCRAGMEGKRLTAPIGGQHGETCQHNNCNSSKADGARSHVNGSPFSIKISRNYGHESRRVLIRIGMFGLTNSGTNPSRCWGITSDNMTDNIFVTNRERHEISAFNSYGQLMFKFGGEGNVKMARNSESLFRPTGIKCDTYNRRLLVADKDHHRIAIFSLEGGYISSFGKVGSDDACFMYPWDVDCSYNGDKIVVSDSKNKRVQLFDRFGNFLNKFTLCEKHSQRCKNCDELDIPRGVSFDADGKTVYVTDFTDSITQIHEDFKKSSKITPDEHFERLQGITVDTVGNILTCETRRNVLRVLRPDGGIQTTVGAIEGIPLYQPLDLTVLRGGVVALLDYDGRVRLF